LPDNFIRLLAQHNSGDGKMLRTLIVLPPVLAIILSSCCLLRSASAQEMCWWNKMAADWHRVHCWPKPFDRADRAAIQAPFSTMQNNGWRRQTTLGEHHFNWETEELNHAGNGQLRWILTQAPLNRRTVYVQQGKTAASTAARVDSVQKSMLDVLSHGPLPEVIQTQRGPASMQAELVDQFYRRFNSTIANPRLPSLDTGKGS